MNGRVLTGVVAMSMMLGFTLAPAWAEPEAGYSKGHGSGYGRGHGMTGRHASTGHLLRGLLGSQKEFGLTEEQVSKLKAIQLDLDRTRIKTEADIMVAERELEALVEDDKADLSTIEGKLKQSEMLEVGLRMAAIKARRDVMAALTPEQSQRIKAVHERLKMMPYRDEKDAGMGHGRMRERGHGGSSKMEPKKDTEKKESKP